MKRQLTNIPASVRQRLQDLAKVRNEDFSFILTRFVAFIRTLGAVSAPPPLSDVIGKLHGVLFPILEAVRNTS